MKGRTAAHPERPCSGKAEVFFEHLGEVTVARLVREAQAKRLCSECPERSMCLRRAMTGREHGAVWGGLNDGERLELARHLVRARV